MATFIKIFGGFAMGVLFLTIILVSFPKDSSYYKNGYLQGQKDFARGIINIEEKQDTILINDFNK